MIGYDRLGTNGRFGNQLFQYAALRGIAAHHGYDWCIPPDDHATYANYGMHHPFKLKNLTEKNIGFVNSNVTPRKTAITKIRLTTFRNINICLFNLDIV